MTRHEIWDEPGVRPPSILAGEYTATHPEEMELARAWLWAPNTKEREQALEVWRSFLKGERGEQ